MRRTQRSRPALECLEDRCCPSLFIYNAGTGTVTPPSPVNAINGPLNLGDNESFPDEYITYMGAGTYKVQDLGANPGTYLFTGVTTLSITQGGVADTLTVDGNFNTLGPGVSLPNWVSVAQDGVAPSTAQENVFQYKDAILNNNGDPNTSTLYVLGQGQNNKVLIGDGTDYTEAVILNITYRDAANGVNTGTVNKTNTTEIGDAWFNGLSYSSQGASATDIVVQGSPSGASPPGNISGQANDYGSANYGFNAKNNFSLSMANGFVGSVYLPGATTTVFGGGPNSSVTLGDPTGATSFTDSNSTVIDLDNTSGGTVTVNDNTSLTNATRIDDYQNVNIDPSGGAHGVNLGKGLTIWNSDAGSTVGVGSATTAGTVTGNVTFATGGFPVVLGDSDDNGSPSTVADTLTVNSRATLKGLLSADLNLSTDTIDVEGTLAGNLSVTGAGSGTDAVKVGPKAVINGNANLNFANGTGKETVVISGYVGGPLTMTLGSGGNVFDLTATAALAGGGTVNMGSGNDEFDFRGGAFVGSGLSVDGGGGTNTLKTDMANLAALTGAGVTINNFQTQDYGLPPGFPE